MRFSIFLIITSCLAAPVPPEVSEVLEAASKPLTGWNGYLKSFFGSSKDKTAQNIEDDWVVANDDIIWHPREGHPEDIPGVKLSKASVEATISKPHVDPEVTTPVVATTIGLDPKKEIVPVTNVPKEPSPRVAPPNDGSSLPKGAREVALRLSKNIDLHAVKIFSKQIKNNKADFASFDSVFNASPDTAALANIELTKIMFNVHDRNLGFKAMLAQSDYLSAKLAAIRTDKTSTPEMIFEASAAVKHNKEWIERNKKDFFKDLPASQTRIK